MKGMGVTALVVADPGTDCIEDTSNLAAVSPNYDSTGGGKKHCGEIVTGQ
jgi:hypothetical protein